MASNHAKRKPANVDAPFGRVSLDWVSQWQEAGISRTAISVMICFASNLYTDESGRICTWFPVNEMSEMLGVAEKTIFKAVGSAKQGGFLKEKKRACYGRCTEYLFMPNSGALNQPKEKAFEVAAANAKNNGSVAFSSSIPASCQTHDPIIPVQRVEGMENGRCLPVDPSPAEGKPALSRNSMTLEQFEALKRGGAFKSGSPNV